MTDINKVATDAKPDVVKAPTTDAKPAVEDKK